MGYRKEKRKLGGAGGTEQPGRACSAERPDKKRKRRPGADRQRRVPLFFRVKIFFSKRWDVLRVEIV